MVDIDQAYDKWIKFSNAYAEWNKALEEWKEFTSSLDSEEFTELMRTMRKRYNDRRNFPQ